MAVPYSETASVSSRHVGINCRKVSTFCTSGAILLSLMGLTGYLPGWSFFGSISPDYIPMAPSTAFSFLISGGAILFLNGRTDPPNVSVFVALAVLLVSLFGLLGFMGHFAGADLNFEDRLVPHLGELDGIPVGRMSFMTGIAFFLSGVAILLLFWKKILPAHQAVIDSIASTSALVVLIISFVLCLAYAYGTPLMYDMEAVIPVALTTACGFLLLSVSILTTQWDMFPVRYLTETSTRSFLLRYILPVAILSVIAGSIAALASNQLPAIHPAFVSALLTILTIMAVGFVATLVSRHLGSKIDSQKKAIATAHEELRESEKKYKTLFETMRQGVVYHDPDGVITSNNRAAEQIIGLESGGMTGRGMDDPEWKFVDRDCNRLAAARHPAMIALNTGQIIKDVVIGVHNPKADDYVWLIVNSIPQFQNDDEKPYQVFSTFIDITRRKQAEDELLRLKNDLEEMVRERTSELSDKIVKLNKSKQAMLLMVEDLNRVTAELKQEREKLKASNTELEAFSYSVSHDLRAPLRAIDGFTKILMEENAVQLDKEGQRVCDVINRNTKKMGQLVDDLLAFSRLGRQHLRKSHIDMESTVKAVCHELATGDGPGRIRFRVKEKLHAAYGDPSMIRQVWVNLISNAIKFSATLDQPEIEITSWIDADCCWYRIRDNGVGFDMQYVGKIFGVFQRLHSARDFEGTGVGLAIVHRIIIRHGGQISAESPPGNGAVFTFSLPVTRP